MTDQTLSTPRSFATPAILLGGLTLCLHLAANGHYGVFRDELYFIVCGEHPALGYVDQPPLVPLIAAASHALFGVALTPLRLLPALAMAATVALSAKFAQALGGGRYAQWLAGLAVLLCPVLLVNGVLLTTDVIQPLTWLACSWLLLRLIQNGDERIWLAFGLVVAVSLWAKYLILFFMVGLGVGILATPLRRSLARPWIYAGAALALALIAPNVWWQATNGWPFLELGKAAANGKNLALSPLAFFGQEILTAGPIMAPLWIAGLWRLSTRPEAPALRIFPIAYVAMTAIFVVSHGKAYYMESFYPTLFAAGAVAFEAWFGLRIRRVVVGVVIVGGLVTVPMVLPILPPADVVRYSRAIGMAHSQAVGEHGAQSVLPQYFADMFGWREMAAKVSAVYQGLPPADRERAVFFGRNYGEAAALDVYGPALGGPPAISGHNSYFLWGPGKYDGSVIITVGGDAAKFGQEFGDVQIAGQIDNPYAMPSETNIPVYVLRAPRRPLAEIWPLLKHYD